MFTWWECWPFREVSLIGSTSCHPPHYHRPLNAWPQLVGLDQSNEISESLDNYGSEFGFLWTNLPLDVWTTGYDRCSNVTSTMFFHYIFMRLDANCSRAINATAWLLLPYYAGFFFWNKLYFSFSVDCNWALVTTKSYNIGLHSFIFLWLSVVGLLMSSMYVVLWCGLNLDLFVISKRGHK
jgi:hypothetical protein